MDGLGQGLLYQRFFTVERVQTRTSLVSILAEGIRCRYQIISACKNRNPSPVFTNLSGKTLFIRSRNKLHSGFQTPTFADHHSIKINNYALIFVCS